MATVGENGWPYVQFRGGPKGFLKVLDQETLGYADFRGKASLILLDYPSRRRLKIWAEVEILDPEEHPELLEKLTMKDYEANIERLVIFQVKAFDWNCPQHIPPRYTIDEIKDLIPKHPEIIEDSCPEI